MINKKFNFVFGIFAMLVLNLLVVSAQLSISNLVRPTNVDETSNSYTFSFNLTNSANSTVNVSFTNNVSFGSVLIPSVSNLGPLSSVTVTGTASGFLNKGGSTQSITVNATASQSDYASVSFNTIINEVFKLCSSGDQGDLRISDFAVNNLGDGEDDEWWPLDEVEIEVEVQNRNTDDSVSDVQVEIFIFDDSDNDVTNDFDLEDEQIDLGKISKKDEEIATFRITEVPADLDEGRYRIYIKAYSDGEEDTQCIATSDDFNQDTYHEVDYTREEDMAVIVRTSDLENKITATCGAKDLAITLPIYNIGSDKEESVLVNLYSKELGIDVYDFIEDLKSGKRAEVSFLVNIPQNAREDTYKIDVFTFFDYDEDGEKLEESSYDANSFEDLDKDFKLQLEVIGCSTKGPSISAALDSEAKLGQELVIKSTITNTGSAGNFIISASGFEDWARLVSISPQTATIGESESKEVIIRLSPTASGFQSFKIDALVNGKSFSQPVSVNIAGQPSISDKFDSKTLLYVVIGLVVLIILVIILIIVRVSKRNEKF